MKRIVYCLVFLLCAISCKESHDQGPSTSGFTKFIGAKIPFELAEKWRHQYSKTESSARTEETWTVTREILVSYVGDLGDFTGLHFRHALDDAGMHRIVITPEQEPGTSSNSAIDANTNTFIDPSTATSWAERYASAYPSVVRSHFFGSSVIQTIISNDSFERLEIVPGVGDNEERMLLLYAWNTLNLSAGKLKDASVDVYDRASPCPPYCSE